MKLPEQDITPARCASLYETGAHLRARARVQSYGSKLQSA